MSSEAPNPGLSLVCDCYRDLLHRTLEGEIFVFNPHTGHTHILNDFSWHLLHACVDTPTSETKLLELAQAYAGEVDQEQLAVHVDHLLQLELLRPVKVNPCA